VGMESILGRPMNWEPLESLADVPSKPGIPYVSVRDGDGSCHVCFDRAIPSQLGRQALARALGVSQADWRVNDHAATVARTVQRLTTPSVSLSAAANG
jgi:hypothetical protein